MVLERVIVLSSQVKQYHADILKSLAHPTRLKILELLREGERCVCEIVPDMGTDQPNVSRHLSLLTKEGILSRRKEGLKVFYRVSNYRVFQILDLTKEILKMHWESRSKILA